MTTQYIDKCLYLLSADESGQRVEPGRFARALVPRAGASEWITVMVEACSKYDGGLMSVATGTNITGETVTVDLTMAYSVHASSSSDDSYTII